MAAVIRCHVVYSVLAGALPQFAEGCALSASTMDAFISSIRSGNAEYEKANLGGELLGVRDALDILSFTGIRIAPRGDIGCQNKNGLAKELQILADKARVMCGLIGCVLAQTS